MRVSVFQEQGSLVGSAYPARTRAPVAVRSPWCRPTQVYWAVPYAEGLRCKPWGPAATSAGVTTTKRHKPLGAQ